MAQLTLSERIPDGIVTHEVTRVHFHGKTDRAEEVTIYESNPRHGVMTCIDGAGQFVEAHAWEWFQGMTSVYREILAGVPIAPREVLWIGAASGLLSRGMLRAGLAFSILELEYDRKYADALRLALETGMSAADTRFPTARRSNVTTIWDDAFAFFPNDIIKGGVFDAVFLDIDPNDPRFPALVSDLYFYCKRGAVITAQADHEDWKLPEAFAEGWELRYDNLGWRYAHRRV
jgi:hypothetical protein